MTPEPADLALLAVAVDQAGDLLGRVTDEHLASPTPCTDWTVGDLVDHLVNAPSHFTTMMRGEKPDWGARPPHVGADREARFRAAGARLVEQWRAVPDGGRSAQIYALSSPLDWQLAELAVHTWDVAAALHEPTTGLDGDVGERGLAFMQGELTADKRAPVFGPEQPAPPDADPYTRIAAFAGRAV